MQCPQWKVIEVIESHRRKGSFHNVSLFSTSNTEVKTVKIKVIKIIVKVLSHLSVCVVENSNIFEHMEAAHHNEITHACGSGGQVS